MGEPGEGWGEAASMTGPGHNSDVNRVAGDQLRSFVERVERLNEELAAINADKSDIFGEAKAMGYDTKILKRVIAARHKDRDQRLEENSIFETYMLALGEDV